MSEHNYLFWLNIWLNILAFCNISKWKQNNTNNIIHANKNKTNKQINKTSLKKKQNWQNI